MSVIKKITGGMQKKYIIYTILSPLSMVGEVIVETYIPYIMAKIIDTGIASHSFEYVVRTGLFMGLLAVVSLILGCCGSVFSACASQGFSDNLRKKMFSAVQDFSFANTDRFSTASLITRLTTDITNAQNVYKMLVQMCWRAPFMLVAGTTMAFIINSKLAAVFLVSIPVIAAAIIIISLAARPRFEKMLRKYDTLNARIQENLIGIRVVKAFVRGEFENRKFEQAADGVRDAQLKAERWMILLSPVMQMVIYSTIIAVMWLGGKQVLFGTMHVGELTSFITYVTQILMSLMMLGMIFTHVVLSIASIKRIVEVLDESPDIKNPLNTVMKVRDGSVVFENVDFSYTGNPDNCVLNRINLRIESGQTAGIIGGTGSSKTTLVSLIPRLYDATRGAVKIGGVDVREYDLQVLRDSVAMVLQKNVLFSGTIRQNLEWGNPEATDMEIISACKAADAHSFIQAFPDGYETVLGQGGVNLSGGQKQRLCIARALLKNPQILILDDSTSAVDTATEGRIQSALKELAPGTTKIIIAQRISSVKDADIIFVLEDGRINGYGTHRELLKKNEIYKEVCASQSQGSGDCDIG